MRFKIKKSLVDKLDDEILVHKLGNPIGELTRAPEGRRWTVYSANPHLPPAMVSIAIISDVFVDFLNGGMFQLIMNPWGALLPDLPKAFRDVGREREAKIIEEVLKLFPSEAIVRDQDKRVAFASTKIVPGGWEGLSKAKSSAMYKKLEKWEIELADLIQSRAFFAAIAAFIRRERDAFEIVSAKKKSVNARTSR